jgi:hypothetical protein
VEPVDADAGGATVPLEPSELAEAAGLFGLAVLRSAPWLVVGLSLPPHPVKLTKKAEAAMHMIRTVLISSLHFSARAPA